MDTEEWIRRAIESGKMELRPLLQTAADSLVEILPEGYGVIVMAVGPMVEAEHGVGNPIDMASVNVDELPQILMHVGGQMLIEQINEAQDRETLQ